MQLDKMLGQVLVRVPDCVAVGFVNMESGLLLQAKTVDSHPEEVLDVVAAATGDLFQGENVRLIERMFDKSRGTSAAPTGYFKEIYVLSDNLLHIFLRGKRDPTNALVVVCRRSVVLGMAMAKARACLQDVEKSV